MTSRRNTLTAYRTVEMKPREAYSSRNALTHYTIKRIKIEKAQ